MRICAAELQNRNIVLLLPQGRTTVVSDSGKPLRVQESWEVDRLLFFSDALSLLIFRHADGRTAGWLLNAKHQRLGDLADLTRTRRPEVRKLVSDVLLPAISLLLCEPGTSPVMRTLSVLAGMDAALRTNLLALIDYLPVNDAQRGPAAEVELVAGSAQGPEPPHEAMKLLGRLADFVHGTVRPRIETMSSEGGRVLVRARYLRLPEIRRLGVLICWLEGQRSPWLLFAGIFGGRHLKLAYRPEAPESPAGFHFTISRDEANLALNVFFRTLLDLSLRDAIGLLRNVERGGIVLRGIRNFGHGLWDELQAVDRIVARQAEWQNPPFVYILRGSSGAELFGPLDDIYPELAGHFILIESPAQALEHAALNGVQIFEISGRFARRSTRKRLTRFALRHGQERGLEAAERSPGRECPCLVLGLRLTNRHPADFLGFYIRLTQRLVETFGELCLILDGINADPETGQAAAMVFNGVTRKQDGNKELVAEHAFVESFREALVGLPVSIVNCVGMSIRDNLFWLSQASFFVAPNGGGLAKLRWALDIPGFVLSSRINHTYCSLVHVYSDPLHMEAPFSPLDMTLPDEVIDLPLEPPRTEPPQVVRIPHPDNFVVDEARVIPRIIERFQASRLQRPASL